MAIPKVGELAPDFELPCDTGQLIRLSSLRGSTVVLYFYPRDDTPGCTAEACDFRDNLAALLSLPTVQNANTPGCTTQACGFRDAYADYRQNAVQVIGISPDGVASHAKFRDKFSLPFPLLADEGHAVASAYGVWGPKTFMGRTYEGVLRTTFLIGPDGRLLRIYENVKPDGHSAQILADLLGAEASG